MNEPLKVYQMRPEDLQYRPRPTTVAGVDPYAETSDLQEAYNMMRQLGEDAWNSPVRKYMLPVNREEWAELPVNIGRTARNVYDAGMYGVNALHEASMAPVRSAASIGEKVKQGWSEKDYVTRPLTYQEPPATIYGPKHYSNDGSYIQSVRPEYIGEGWDY